MPMVRLAASHVVQQPLMATDGLPLLCDVVVCNEVAIKSPIGWWRLAMQVQGLRVSAMVCWAARHFFGLIQASRRRENVIAIVGIIVKSLT